MITRGAEWESTLNLGSGIHWTLGITYADARYGRKLNRDTSEAELFLEQDFETLEDFAEIENLEGRQITQAPYWQGSTSLFVEQPVGSNVVYGNLNVGFRGERNTGSNLEEGKDVPDEVLVNLQLGLRAQSDRWDVQVWARNLFDEHVNTLVFNSVFQDESLSTFFGPPRMVGGTLRLSF